MSFLLIKKNTLILQGKSFILDDLYSLDFLKFSNEVAEKFYDKSYYVNELYLNTYQPWLALKFFIKNEKITTIEFESPDRDLCALIKDLEFHCDFKIINKGYSFSQVKDRFLAYFNLLLTTFYLAFRMIRIPKKSNFDEHPENTFILTRTVAADKKLKNFDFPKISEDFNKKESIYSKFSLFRRVFWVLESFFNSVSHLKTIETNIKFNVGNNSLIIAYSIYGIRLVHTLLYEKVLDAYFKLHKNSTIYTGNNLDRFSIVEEKTAKKNNIKVVCIPHGLEYGFKFPKGFSGDLFYATTNYAADYFNQMYTTDKFIFDRKVAEKMFMVNPIKQSHEKKVVFFTEPREVYVNIGIIIELLPLLKKVGVRLSLKLHPKDSEKNYLSFDIDYLDSIEEALSDNICFARKSTTLIECLYNNSKAAAILTNSKDSSLFYTFPSLQTEEIFISNNINELSQWILKNLNENE